MLEKITKEFQAQEEVLRAGGGEAGRKRQLRLGRLTARERLAELLDPNEPFREVGLWSAWEMYQEWGNLPAAGVIGGVGRVCGRPMMVVANDATVKAGACFPQTVKKMIRAQKIAMEFRLPLIYLVDSSGVFLPLQDEIFPDEDDFGRIFRNNAVISAMGIPQYAAVMGNCIAGGGYLPALCDTVLMTEGSQMCLAGASLVKAAIGQEVEPEDLGGAAMHASISGTVDFHEPDDPTCLKRLRSLVEMLPDERTNNGLIEEKPEVDPQELYKICEGQYDVRDLLKCIVDEGSMLEYKADFGPTVVTTFAKIGGQAVGIVASQKKPERTGAGEQQIGGVMYGDSSEKAARFVMDCNQTQVPIIFFQDVQGFMVGPRSEQSGIIKAGAKLVNAMSNSVVPKITVIVGGSYGAGHYALCGKAYDPCLMLAWPNSKYAVMGADSAAGTLLSLKARVASRDGHDLTEEELEQLRVEVKKQYEGQADIRYGAARGWVDAIIEPHTTRDWLADALRWLPKDKELKEFKTGVFQA